MSTKLKTQQRMHAGFILAITFLLVLGFNRLYQRCFSTLQITVNSVYEDRVQVQDYIYQLNNIFHNKRLRFISNDDFILTTAENEKTEKLFHNFSLTELTTVEYNILNEINKQFEKLKKSEVKVLESSDNLKNGVLVMSLQTLENIDQHLNKLALIQLEESKQMTQLANKTLDRNLFISKLELAFLFVTGIILLTLIFYPVKTKQPVLD